MNTKPQFLITSFLESYQGTLEELRRKLFDKGVLSKDYIEEGLMLLYDKYESPITSDFKRECRSLIIDRNTLKIKAYTCETPRINKEGMEFLIANMNHSKLQINPCYEGTILSVFNHNNKWYVSTRRCLDSNESKFSNDENSHFELFLDVLKSSGYETVDDFYNKLDNTKSYYFVLIHYKNKHMINYTKYFGENYKKLCLITVRDNDLVEQDLYNHPVSFASFDKTENIFVPEKLGSIEDFSNTNKVVKYDEVPDNEGVVIKLWNDKTLKYYLIKLQYANYQFALVQGPERNIFKGLLCLYQNDKLSDYFNQNTNSQHLRKITNPLNTYESYDTIGLVDSVFKVCTSELYELFKLLWSIKTGQHQNKELYELLPKEYKDIMFAVRGIYYKKKAEIHSKPKEEVSLTDIKNSHLKITDIYNYLKSLPTDTIVAFLRMRKLMFNWVKSDSYNKCLKDFGTVSSQCDRVHIKLCAILTNKLFPNIMPTDIPPQRESQDVVV
jgi:hypothetical protein